MSRSLNEIGLLCKRAARGAGLDWGLAEDAARGARWTSSFGLPGPEMLLSRLETLDGQAVETFSPDVATSSWAAGGERLCPLTAGAALADRALQLPAYGTVTMHAMICPLLIAPFASDAAQFLEAPVQVSWAGLALTVSGGQMHLAGARERLHDEWTDTLTCSVAMSLPEPSIAPGFRGTIDDEIWQRLTLLAARTLAPATEASRRLGAGADHTATPTSIEPR